jgi:hypothetical protein
MRRQRFKLLMESSCELTGSLCGRLYRLRLAGMVLSNHAIEGYLIIELMSSTNIV